MTLLYFRLAGNFNVLRMTDIIRAKDLGIQTQLLRLPCDQCSFSIMSGNEKGIIPQALYLCKLD